MQHSTRQAELDRLFNARKGHMPHISISDDNHHVTEAIGSYYDDYDADDAPGPGTPSGDPRPLSFLSSPSEKESYSRSKRQGSYFETPRSPLSDAQPNERLLPSAAEQHPQSPKGASRPGFAGAANQTEPQPPPQLPPPLTRQSSSETAVQPFPLNDIDYESSPAAVAQELSNLQAIRRMSMNVDAADPDLPSFASIPAVAPKQSDSDSDASKLFWVPARLHPELAPKEFKTFIEDRVGKIRRRSGSEDSLSPESLERSSSESSLRRKKSMLSHQIDTKGNYEDGAERLERKRSKGVHGEGQTTVTNLLELEELVNDPSQLMSRMSLDAARRSQDSAIDVPPGEDLPILPPTGALKRSTRTTYRRGSLKKGERVPFSKRAQQRQPDGENEESLTPSIGNEDPEPSKGSQRTQTEPTLATDGPVRENFSRPSVRRQNTVGAQSRTAPQEVQSKSDFAAGSQPASLVSGQDYEVDNENEDDDYYAQAARPSLQTDSSQPESLPFQSLDASSQSLSGSSASSPQPQARQFHSRIASAGRTTAQLPGYTNTNPLPQIVETLADGTKVPTSNLMQNLPERKSSHELPRQFQRGGAHTRPVPGRSNSHTSTLEDISSRPSPLPGSGSTRTDALTVVPTFDEKKPDKKEVSRKSSWKWILGNDDDDRERKAKEDKAAETASARAKSSKLSKTSIDKARLDVLQNSIDGNVPARGRESLVLNRDEIKLDDERPLTKSSKKSSDTPRKEKDTSLLSAIFGGGKKKNQSEHSEARERKRKSDRNSSPDALPRFLKPDVDYNWTRFSILEERAIYRMAHIKLANPRRALHSQVLLSNFMYSYLAKVQMMHPQIQIPGGQRASQQQGSKGDDDAQKQQQQQSREQDRPAEYNQYLRWQEQQARQDAAAQATEYESVTDQAVTTERPGHDSDEHSNNAGYDQTYGHEQQSDNNYNNSTSNDSRYLQRQMDHADAANGGGGGVGAGGGGGRAASSRPNGNATRPRASSLRNPPQPTTPSARKSSPSSASGGYSVASTHDYLGYPRNESWNHSPQYHSGSSHSQTPDLWDDNDDDERSGDLW